jgi:hypothetical protein
VKGKLPAVQTPESNETAGTGSVSLVIVRRPKQTTRQIARAMHHTLRQQALIVKAVENQVPVEWLFNAE